MRRPRWICLFAAIIAINAGAQAPAKYVFDGAPIRVWVSRVLEDTSNFRRDRAGAAIRRAPAVFRRELIRTLVPAIERSGPAQTVALNTVSRIVNEGQFGPIMNERGFDLVPAVAAMQRIAEERGNPNRRLAWFLLARTDSATRRTLLPFARAGLLDPEPGIRWQAIEIIALAREAEDVSRLLVAANDTAADVRGRALSSLSRWQPRRALPLFMDALRDSVEDVRQNAIAALGRVGPAASAAVPALLRIVGDSSARRDLRAVAARSLSMILPPGNPQNYIQVELADEGAGLRSDGLGPYVNGADSVLVTKAASLNLDLAGPRGDGRTMELRAVRPLRRTLVIDLSKPVKESGAPSLGVVRDNEAVVHIAFTHVHERTMISIARLDPSDSLIPVERTEVQFRIDGKPHILQMGEWTQGEFNRNAPRISGAGTSTASVSHPDLATWTVVAPPGSRARLWDLTDAAHPVDRGLYVVPFRFRWSLLDPP